MKKILLIGLTCAGVLSLWGQGTLRVSAGTALKSSGTAYLVLDNIHVVNEGLLQQEPGGVLKMTGSASVNWSGGGTSTLDELRMTKSATASLNLQAGVIVRTKVHFSGGIIDLGNSVLDLGDAGELSEESQASRAFTSGTGYIRAVRNLSSPSGENVGKLGAIITSKADLGITTIRRGHQGQSGLPGGNSVLRYYDIEPANNVTLKATLRLHYFDIETNSIPEASLYQWKSKDNVNWDFVGADARNDQANYVERNNISKFERFTLASATAPLFTDCPGNMIVSANLSRCRASVPFGATASGIPAPAITYRIGTTVITSPYIFPKGTTTVTATASNGVAPDATCTFTVTVVCGPVAPITQAVTDTREPMVSPLVVTARPNPSSSYFTLNLSSGGQEPVSLRVVDLLGREVEQWSNVAPNSVLHLGQRYRPGIYLVQAAQGSRVVVLRLVKGAE